MPGVFTSIAVAARRRHVLHRPAHAAL